MRLEGHPHIRPRSGSSTSGTQYTSRGMNLTLLLRIGKGGGGGGAGTSGGGGVSTLCV